MLCRLFVAFVLLCLGAGTGRADGDAEAGAAVFRKCAACHTASEPVSRVGPSLQGVVGRPVATFPGYGYSAAMAAFGADGKVWDEDRLSQYLLAPKAMVPGTKMTFVGLRKPKDIADVLAYLKSTAPSK